MNSHQASNFGLLFALRLRTHPDNRILQFHLINECSSNRTRKSARNSKAKEKKNHHERSEEMRNTNEANKVSFRFGLKKSLCIERKSSQRVSNLESKLIAISWMTWWAFSFISFISFTLIRSKSWFIQKIVNANTTTIHSSGLLRAISF